MSQLRHKINIKISILDKIRSKLFKFTRKIKSRSEMTLGKFFLTIIRTCAILIDIGTGC